MKMKLAIPPLMAVAIASGVLAEDRWVFLPCNFWGKGTNVHALAWFTNTAARRYLPRSRSRSGAERHPISFSPVLKER